MTLHVACNIYTFCTKVRGSWNDVGLNYDARPPLELSSDYWFIKINVEDFGMIENIIKIINMLRGHFSATLHRYKSLTEP